MKIPLKMAEVLEEHYIYDNILTLIKSIYGVVHVTRCWFKEHIKTVALNVGFKQCNSGFKQCNAGFKQCNAGPSVLYR